MKKLLKYFAFAAATTLLAVGCSVDFVDADDALFGDSDSNSNSATTTLYASTPSQTRVWFAEDDESNINLTWEEEDEFTLYDAYDEYVGLFICTDATTGRFESDDALLTKEASYTAKYNEQKDISSQNGDAIVQLDEACQMEATFTYGDNEAIEFSHTMAVMTFIFTSANRPAKLIFENGNNDSYTVIYNEIEPTNGYYTSHIMIHPCDDTERTLTFSLLDSDGEAYDIRTTTTTKEYEAGVRYTSPVSQLAPTIMLGSGTATDPYQIATSTQLRDIAEAVNDGTTTYEGKYFVMTNNIDLNNEEFTAIGTMDNPFYGTFDGDGYEVSGLYINKSGSDYEYLALWGNISGATIQNLGVSGSVSVAATSYVHYIGGIVGYATSSTISNCYSNVAVTTTSTSGTNSNYVGGIAGYASLSTISDCYNSGVVIGGDDSGAIDNVGGIVGYTTGATTTNCYNAAKVSSSGSYVGGVAGQAYSASTTNCYNIAAVDGLKNVGGVVGFATQSSSTINCHNTATIEGSENVGGIAGYLSYYTLTINCYNTGAIKGSSYVGGVAGRLKSATVNNCYNSTTVEGSSNVGGVVGYNNYSEVSNCYYNNESFTATTSYGSGYTSSYMQSTDFVNELNNNAYNYNSNNPIAIQACAWDRFADSYPHLDYTAEIIYTATDI